MSDTCLCGRGYPHPPEVCPNSPPMTTPSPKTVIESAPRTPHEQHDRFLDGCPVSNEIVEFNRWIRPIERVDDAVKAASPCPTCYAQPPLQPCRREGGGVHMARAWAAAYEFGRIMQRVARAKVHTFRHSGEQWRILPADEVEALEALEEAVHKAREEHGLNCLDHLRLCEIDSLLDAATNLAAVRAKQQVSQ